MKERLTDNRSTERNGGAIFRSVLVMVRSGASQRKELFPVECDVWLRDG